MIRRICIVAAFMVGFWQGFWPQVRSVGLVHLALLAMVVAYWASRQ